MICDQSLISLQLTGDGVVGVAAETAVVFVTDRFVGSNLGSESSSLESGVAPTGRTVTTWS